MNALIVDSTGDRIALAVCKNGVWETFLGDKGARRHLAELLSEIQRLLASVSLSVSDVETVGVVTGPGSYTGLRIGVSTVNAISRGSGAKIVEITSLEEILFNEKQGIAVLDSGVGNYYALKREDWAESYLVMSKEEVLGSTLPVFYKESVNFPSLIDAFEEKVRQNKFVKIAAPFYIKKSQAERLKSGDFTSK